MGAPPPSPTPSSFPASRLLPFRALPVGRVWPRDCLPWGPHGGRGEGGRGAPVRPRAVDPGPPASPRVRPLPAAPTPPPLSASLGGGRGTGGGARDHSSGGDQVRRRQFGSSIFLPWERQA